MTVIRFDIAQNPPEVETVWLGYFEHAPAGGHSPGGGA